MNHKTLIALLSLVFLSVASLVTITRVLSAPGDLDTTFNGTGSARVGFGQGDDAGNAIAAQADGKLVVVGTTTGTHPNFEVIRYNTDGSLDTSFGGLGVGKIRTSVGSFGGRATAVKIQSDNKIVVAGTVFDNNTATGPSDFGLIRLNSDGSVDQSFGQFGQVVSEIQPGSDFVAGLAIQPNGRLLVVGYSFSGVESSVTISRYNSDGSPDTSFNGTGTAITVVGQDRSFGSAVAVQADGKILVAGTTQVNLAGAHDFFILRYNSNGIQDTSWGNAGLVITDFGGTKADDHAASIAIQPGTPTVADSIVVAGFSFDLTTAVSRFAVARYTLDGVLDSSFGTGGKVTTSITSENDRATSIGIQSPNTIFRKIVVAGRSQIGGSSAFSAVRYNADGSLDSTFDGDGKVTTSFGLNAAANGIAILPSSRFALAGTATFDANSEGDFAVARYNSDGSADSAFDGDGRRVDDGDLNSNARAVTVQSDQKAVIVGDCYEDDTKVFALARYNESGTLDTSFDGDGRLITKFGVDDSARAVVIQPDGRIVVVGGTYDGQIARFALARYNSNGSLDNSFGVGGKAITPASTSETASGVAIQTDGKIVVAGSVETSGFNSIFGVVRYNTNGTLDNSFGSSGKVTTALGTGAITIGVVIQPDGRILLGGFSGIGGVDQFVVARYNTNGSLDSSFGQGGIAATRVGNTASFANAIALQADGRIVVGGQADNFIGLARFNSNGSLDSTFDGDGKLQIQEPSGFSAARGVAIQNDGKILAGGFVSNPITSADFMVMRFNSNGSIDTSYGNNGRVVADLANRNSDLAQGIALDPSGRAVLAGQANEYFMTMRVLGGSVATPTPTPTPTPPPTPTPTPTPTPPANVVQFSASNYTVQEDCTSVTITVNRVGDTSGPASVDYATSDVVATEKRDYIKTLGTMSFAAGQTTKSFAVLINEDSFVEGTENFNVNLTNPVGLSLGGPTVSSVFIADDPTELPGNPIDDPQNFVCQHYHDFLNRDPDPSGLAFWTGTITSCNGDPQCIAVKRINASAAFYLSIEFQQTGYFVERIYKTSFGNATGTSTLNGTHQLPVPIVQLSEFLSDTQLIGLGVVVGQGNWEQLLDDNKSAFANRFVLRSRFINAFPITMSAAQFVDALNVNAGNPLSQSERNLLVAALESGAKTRAQVLQAVAQDTDLVNGESNRAFVLMQYFGYLRRNPNDPQDSDHTGYDFWLTKLNQFGGNFQDAEMVKAFILSSEYRNRFGP